MAISTPELEERGWMYHVLWGFLLLFMPCGVPWFMKIHLPNISSYLVMKQGMETISVIDLS